VSSRDEGKKKERKERENIKRETLLEKRRGKTQFLTCGNWKKKTENYAPLREEAGGEKQGEPSG